MEANADVLATNGMCWNKKKYQRVCVGSLVNTCVNNVLEMCWIHEADVLEMCWECVGSS